MKTIRHRSAARDKLLHIETDGCVVNIRVGLEDSEGHKVTSVEIIPDDESRSSDIDGHYWDLDGHLNNRVIRRNEPGACPHANVTWLSGSYYNCNKCRKDLRKEIRANGGDGVVVWHPAKF